MLTTSVLSGYLGKVGTVWVGNMKVNVKVVDVKQSYGCLRYQVSPVDGSGATWMDAGSVSLNKEGVYFAQSDELAY